MPVTKSVGESSKQCAAVSTAVGEMSDPPQRYEPPVEYVMSSRANQGELVMGVGA
jgi:hypothetical protein